MKKLISLLFLLLLFNGNMDVSTNITTASENLDTLNYQIEQYSLPDLPSEH